MFAIFFAIAVYYVSAQECVDQDITAFTGGLGCAQLYAALIGADPPLDCLTDLADYGLTGQTLAMYCPQTCGTCDPGDAGDDDEGDDDEGDDDDDDEDDEGCGGEGHNVLSETDDDCVTEWCGHYDEACCVANNAMGGGPCEEPYVCQDDMCVAGPLGCGEGYNYNPTTSECEWCGWIDEPCCTDNLAFNSTTGCESDFECIDDRCYHEIPDEWACHTEKCHDDGHWIEVDFGEFETIEECHQLCACHPEATAMQMNHDGWCGCMTLEEGVVFQDALADDAQHLGNDTECVLCNVETFINEDCGPSATCVESVCHDEGIWVEVGWGEDYFTIEECQNHCACHEEATAMQWNSPEDDETPGFCGCLIFEADSFADAILHNNTAADDNNDGCTICDIEYVMGFSCHEYIEEECEDDEDFAEYNDGIGCEEALEANDWDCDWEVWPGEPIGWFCAATCEWCEDECADAEWFEDEYGEDCETAVGGSGEWTDACEIEAWPDEPIWWFCPVACGECEPEDGEDGAGASALGSAETSAITFTAVAIMLALL